MAKKIFSIAGEKTKNIAGGTILSAGRRYSFLSYNKSKY